MPEYSQVQTYIKCDQSNIKEIILDFISTLNDCGIKDAEMISAISGLEWALDEDGSMYVSGGEVTKEIIIAEQLIHIRPFVMGWTSKSFKALQQSWLEVSFLLWTEEIVQSQLDYVLREEHRSVIWKLMNSFSQHLPNQSGVYFTNEATDGRPWEAFVQNDLENIWMFDAAIINKDIMKYYEAIDESIFFSNLQDNELLIARKETWIKEPW
ncbi:hypothetical protein [Paenibacillus sp. NAIST15-1]|uniref:hypothetical protein n=1 Tax=Paenibacillus sp. NAIST15-1 TaxID=1605994 RepID=UPI000869D27E|nr:hypothetical protein [Paenibacillus sp. NAIST15-1]GAV11706.1 hypothetical protein PBN151_1635 [Paenibacillus sp. NAIST15-1]